MDDGTPITWGQLKSALKRAGQHADTYSDSSDPHSEIAQGTAGIAIAHVEAALDEEFDRARLQAEIEAASGVTS